MTNTVSKNNRRILVAPSIQTYYPEDWTWQDYLRELEIKYNNWVNTFTTTEMSMKDVNDLMQDIYPGPYRVVAQYISERMVIELSLKFDDPVEQTIWLLKNS